MQLNSFTERSVTLQHGYQYADKSLLLSPLETGKRSGHEAKKAELNDRKKNDDNGNRNIRKIRQDEERKQEAEEAAKRQNEKHIYERKAAEERQKCGYKHSCLCRSNDKKKNISGKIKRKLLSKLLKDKR